MITNVVTNLKYRPDIDGLRAIAVLSVMIYHAFPSLLKGGFAGVDVFFVVSGFLISTILFQNIDNGTFSIIDFLLRRIRRIFPALALVLYSVFIFGWSCLHPDELQQLGKHTAASAGFIQNFTLWKEAGYFDNISGTKPLLHIWSLGIEEQFYFVWPILFLVAGKFGGSHKKFFFLISMFSVFAISFTLSEELIKTDPSKTFYLPQYRIWELAIGGILSWIVHYKPDVLLPKLAKKRLKDGFAFSGVVILGYVFFIFDENTIFPGRNALLPVLATTSIIFAGQESFLNRKFLSNRFLVALGLISYPLYLWHWPILSFGRIIYGEEPTVEFRIFAVAISVLLSWFTFKAIEEPFRIENKNIKFKVATLCCLLIMIGASGYFFHQLKNETALTEEKKRTSQIVSLAYNKCSKIYPKWNDKEGLGTDQRCRMQKKNNSIVLIGDSHSSQLFYGFIDKLKLTNESVANFPASCAAPFLNVSYGILPHWEFRRNNGRLMKMGFDYIGQTPSVHTVYLAHSPKCSFGNIIDLENPNEKNDEIVLKNGLIRTLRFLESKNKNIVIVLDNPPFPFDPGNCKPRGAFWDSFKTGCDVKVNSEALDRYKRIVNEVVIGQFPKVTILDLAPFFCKSGKCSPVVNGKILYSDSHHLSDEGSVYVADYLLGALE